VLDAAFADRLDCVIGVDLAFWFGYGKTLGAEPGTDAALQARTALQQKGLALFDEYLQNNSDTTFVIGDYPDLTGAVPMMITPDMIPTKNELAELNRRLLAWAKERPDVHVFPLSKSLERLRQGECKITVDGTEQTVGADAAFQIARVHPTRLGVAVMMRDLTRWLSHNVRQQLRPIDTTDQTLSAAAMDRGEPQPRAREAGGRVRAR